MTSRGEIWPGDTVYSPAPLPSATADWSTGNSATTQAKRGSAVTDLVPGGYVARSMTATEVSERRERRDRIRKLLIGCTASQLHDIENVIKRIKDLSSDAERTVDG